MNKWSVMLDASPAVTPQEILVTIKHHEAKTKPTDMQGFLMVIATVNIFQNTCYPGEKGRIHEGKVVFTTLSKYCSSYCIRCTPLGFSSWRDVSVVAACCPSNAIN